MKARPTTAAGLMTALLGTVIAPIQASAQGAIQAKAPARIPDASERESPMSVRAKIRAEGERALEPVLDALRTGNPEARIHALRCLIEIGPSVRAALPDLVQAAAHPDSRIARVATNALCGAIDHVTAAEKDAIADALLVPPNPVVTDRMRARFMAHKALPPGSPAETLIAALDSPDPLEVEIALRRLGAKPLVLHRATEQLETLYARKEMRLQRTVTTSQGVEVSLKDQGDSMPRLRQIIAEYAVAVAPDRPIALPGHLAKIEDAATPRLDRVASIRALGEIGHRDPTTIRPLRVAALTDDPLIAREAVIALGMLGARGILEHLEPQLDPAVRPAALAALRPRSRR